ncbi:thioesterase domain-containing protein, partial [Pseudomonas syringae]|uniref:thioesterase domain-containing protein n=3 Tax=Pseudomonas syringae group TaxID=136849 RepID=UPI000D4A3B61
AYGQRGYEAPLGEVESLLAGLWSELLQVERVGRHDNFFALGGHSLILITLIDRLNDMGMQLEVSHVFSNPVLNEMAREITKRDSFSERLAENMVSIRLSKNESFKLFLVHESTGDIVSYSELASCLDSRISVYGIKLPANLIKPISLLKLSQSYVGEISKLQISGPYFIAGWSGGGHIAYEIARQLLEKEETVGYLGMIDSVFPGQEDAQIVLSSKSEEDLQKEILLRFMRSSDAVDSASIEVLLRKHGLLETMKVISRAGLLPSGFDFKFVKAKSDLTRELSRACLTYIPNKLCSLKKIFLYVGDPEENVDPSYGWASFLTQQLNLKIVGGTHTSILKAGNVELLADHMSRDIIKENY